MFSAAALNDPGYDDWRQAEAAVFAVMERLRRGQAPSLDGASASALRRLGYLAEITLLFLDAADPAMLKRLEQEVRRRLADGVAGDPLPVVPGAKRPGRVPAFDDVGTLWNVAPGVSLARYKAEAPALDLP